MNSQQKQFPLRAGSGAMAVIVPGNLPVQRHSLTFRLSPQEVAEGYNAKCLTCGKCFKSIIEVDGTDCR